MTKKREDFNDEQKMIADDLDKASALEAVALSEGGKILVAGLLDDIVGCVDTLASKYKDMTLEQFVSTCADLKTKLDLRRAITRSPKNKKYLQVVFDEATKE